MDGKIISVENLIQDDTFVHWVYQSDQGDMDYWNKWLASNPDQQPVAEQAALIIRGVAFNKKKLSPELIESSWNELEDRIFSEKLIRNVWWKKSYAIAATIALILISVASVYLLIFSGSEKITTGYGEMKQVTLPDGTKVTLNANSTLRYDEESMDSPERIVTLEGEAFFAVTKKRQPVSKFLVQTDNGVVEVLGTEFNVNSRHGKTKVVLNSGKIKFNTRSQQTYMEPGEMVEYSKQKPDIKLEKVDPEVHSAWRNQRLKFNDTPLLELARVLEDNYGLKVIITNKALLEKKVTGEISTKDVEVILKAVSRLFDIRVEKKGNTIYLS